MHQSIPQSSGRGSVSGCETFWLAQKRWFHSKAQIYRPLPYTQSLFNGFPQTPQVKCKARNSKKIKPNQATALQRHKSPQLMQGLSLRKGIALQTETTKDSKMLIARELSLSA